MILELDKTGQYMTIGNKRPNKQSELSPEQLAHEQLFAESAWLLFNHRNQILADPSMIYAPVNMRNGLMYAGTKPFDGATIGVYLDWWYKCAGTIQIDERGVPRLMIRFGGSPLTKINKCRMVAYDGVESEISSKEFRFIYESFAEINHRYQRPDERPAKPYTLEEVVKRIKC